ncbi:extracellular solute-binding protein [Bosea sp. (in: a-proteobacteria)]|uniref:extracellular solute-binding protein n=1 Tax=Bosea sp. (in: a-proteobacteria) TaxID=1871050 RepID=UPI0026032812|nr:extracellular solute-binding protein [Bosea sp. (in: a-proteobacteria)]MCO5093271.1 extracellular solute-binding protein [Bosea sp. (in: a-proteobacteria)]
MARGSAALADSAPARHAIAMHGEPALPPGFDHLPYADPKAPKGGRIVLGIQGTFDSLNPLVVLGVAPDAVPKYVQQSLLFRSADEPFTAYGLIASAVELDADRTRLAFELDERARFSDGRPVTAEDVIFTFEMLKTKGKPFHRGSLARVTRAEAVSPRRVEFALGDGSNRELPLVIGAMPIFARHATDAERFGETSFRPALGCGAYAVAEVRPGESLTLKRRRDFWAEDHPLMRGLHNPDEIRYDFYRDSNALFEAFKAGLYDVRIEGDPTRWMTGYDVPAVHDGRIRRKTLHFDTPKGMTGLVFNTRRPIFADPRVREALGLMFDFEWVNRNLFHGVYRRAGSFFSDSELSALGQPADAREKALLSGFPGAVREDILAGSWRPSETDGSGRDREPARKALDLLKAAGHALQGGVLRNAQGEPFAFEITVTSRPQERLALNYAQSLSRLGIAVAVRLIDDVQYWRRLSTFDFEMIQWTWPASASPGNEQIGRWGSANARRNGALNYAGVASPAVDAVLQALLSARERADFVAAVRALDRLLIAGFYVVPLYYLPDFWIALAQGVELTGRQPAYVLSTETLARLPAAPAPAN